MKKKVEERMGCEGFGGVDTTTYICISIVCGWMDGWIVRWRRYTIIYIYIISNNEAPSNLYITF